MDSCDWPWWIMFAAAMVSSYFREMRLRRERNDPRCTLFYTYQAAMVLLFPSESSLKSGFEP